MSAAHHKYLLANITQDYFEGKLMGCTGHVKGITLRNMWSLAKQVIVFYPKECIFGYASIWSNEYIDYVISHETTAKKMIEKLEMRYQHGRPPHVFFCQEGIMTPNNKYLEENLHGTLKENLSKPALRAVLNWIRNKDVLQGDVNIVVADFVNLYDFCKEVVKVNYVKRPLKRYDFEPKSCACAIV